jgi:hypothetical protein
MRILLVGMQVGKVKYLWIINVFLGTIQGQSSFIESLAWQRHTGSIQVYHE